jgi:hypothetical protein
MVFSFIKREKQNNPACKMKKDSTKIEKEP